jgi:hypothetical protein
MRIFYKIVGGLLMACGAFMLLGFIAEWAQGSSNSSLGIQFVVLFCCVLMPLLLGFSLIRRSSTPRIDIALEPQSSVSTDWDARPNDNETDETAVPSGATLAHSSSSVNSLGTNIRIRFSLTRFDLFKVLTATLMSRRPLQVLLLLIVAFCGITGFTAESIVGKSVAYRALYAGAEIIFVLSAGFIAATLLNVLWCFRVKAKGGHWRAHDRGHRRGPHRDHRLQHLSPPLVWIS